MSEPRHDERKAGGRLGVLLLLGALLASMLLAACDDDDDDATATVTATSTATSTATASPTGTPTEGPPAPTNVRLSGAIPDLSATVPPGEGEQGRITIEWEADSTGGAEGFRVYLKDCDGAVETALDVGADERSYGPLQPCRPGGDVGVSAFDVTGESAIVWANEPD